MKHARFLLLCITALLTSCSPFFMNGQRETARYQIKVQQAVDNIKPSIVRIEVVVTSDRQGRKVKREAAGSGVIISPEGYVVTNHHVAGNAQYILCTLADRKTIEADLIGTDALTDTTVLKLREERQYPFASFGDSSKIQVGDEVLALGSPMALSQSVTKGIVSNTELIMPRYIRSIRGFHLNGEDVGSVVRWIGHDAAIYSGNSGGPLINLQGEIIGINEINLGLGGAIPGNLVRDISLQLIENGYVQRSWFGLQLQPLLRSSPVEKGVLLSGTVKNSPAYEAGLQPGDIIQKAGGQPVHARFAEELPLINKFLMSFPIGEAVELELIRNDEIKFYSVMARERERRIPDSYELREWGITFREPSFYDMVERGLDSRTGVIITSTRPGGSAADAKPDIKAGDLILQVNDQEIRSRQDLFSITETLLENGDTTVPAMVRYWRDDEEFLTVANVGIQEPAHSPREAIRSWLPFETQVLTRDLASQKGIEGTTGVRITRIYSSLITDENSIQVGDIIITLDGESIPASSEPEDSRIFSNMVRQYRIGSEVELGFLRNGQKMSAIMKTLRSPLLPREMDRYRNHFFEFTLREISPLDRIQRNWTEEVKGVFVEEVVSGSWAALANVDVGDLIMQINDISISDTQEAREILEKSFREKWQSVVLKVLRKNTTYFLEIIPDWRTE